MTVAERLKGEREKLGLSQSRWGELAKVVKQTVIQWEKGASAPDAIQLSALAENGADVQYIITGKRPERLPGRPLNTEVLEGVIEWLEERLARSRKTISPEKKAQAILLAYQLVEQDEVTNMEERLAPVLKLVA